MTSILTGDIVNSRSVQNHELWMEPLKEVFRRHGQEPGTWEIFRGDHFQLEVSDVRESLLQAILIKATVKCVPDLDVRIAVGIGEVSYRADKISESNGEAFIRSGELFEEMKKTTLAIRSPWPEFDGQMNLHLELALLTMDNWTPSSAEVVKLGIQHPHATQKELASMLGISQGRVSERQQRAGSDAVHNMELRYRDLLSVYL